MNKYLELLKSKFKKTNDIQEKPIIAGVDCSYYCQYSGEVCQTECQEPCQTNTCQICQNPCESDCQTGCETICQTGCQVSCQTLCQLSCQSDCQLGCQTTCESICQTGCEVSCQLSCQLACQACQDYCELNCETYCESFCQTTCQSICQDTCMVVCQNACEYSCQTCQTACELSCQDACQLACQTCQSVCESEEAPVRPPLSNVISLSSGTSYECVFYGGILCAKIIPVGTWSTFQSNINAVRQYKGLSDYPFTAQSMQSLYDKYNEAKAAICAVSQGSLSTISKGDKNIVSTVNALEDQLNSIT